MSKQTPRGKTYLDYMALGHTKSETARHFGVSHQAVGQSIRYYRSNAFRMAMKQNQNEIYRANPAVRTRAHDRYIARRARAQQSLNGPAQ